jgi:hypothetical protein
MLLNVETKEDYNESKSHRLYGFAKLVTSLRNKLKLNLKFQN